MANEESGKETADEKEPGTPKGAAGEGPPRHLPERRGSAQALGGRRASDRRGPGNGGGKDKEDEEHGDDTKHKDDQKDDEKDDEKDDDEKDGDKKDENGKDSKDSKDKPSALKKTWVRVVLAIVVLVVLVAAIIWLVQYLTHGRYVQNTNDAYVKADKVSVTATVTARVTRIAIVDNQVVKAGDLLLELDTRASAARVQQYAAQANQARAEADQYRSEMLEQEATVAQNAAQARGAEVQRDYHAAEVRRYAPLVATGAEKDEQLAQLQSQRDQAAQVVQQYRAAELAARRKIATLRTQVAQADAKLQQALAQAQQAAVDVDNSVLRAAVDGRVGDRQVFLGTYVTAGTQMMTVIPVDAIYVEANFKETQLGLMRVGQPVAIRVDALNGTRMAGTVVSFAPATGAEFSVLPAQNATGNFTKIVQRVPVRIRLDDAGPEARRVLVPGLSVVVDVDTVGDKDDIERRQNEEKDRKDSAKQQHDSQVERDRRQREPGAGR